MAFPKGNKYAKNNSNVGTKTKYEFAAEVLNNGLANLIHNEELVKLKNKKIRTLDEIRTLVTPVTVKGIVDRKDITTKGEKITDDSKIDKITNLLNDLHKGRGIRGDGEIASTLDTQIQDKE
jgi:predicted methyltransferase